jgi:succinyl-CoA synthetase alpha subunit
MSLLASWLAGKGDPGQAKVLVQGITGNYGRFHTRLMLEYGTPIVAGVTPGKGGQEVHGVPVYNTVKEAVEKHGVNASVVFVPARFYKNAVLEALEAGVKVVVGITEKVPVRDTLETIKKAREVGANIIGPNTPGVIFPASKLKMGIMPPKPFQPGRIAVFSRSGTLTYEINNYIRLAGLGTFVALGIGGDPVNSTNFIECLEMVRDNPNVDAVVIIGEIGGDAEERVARYVAETDYPKPLVAYVAGRTAPKEKRMGHAGAIVYGTYGSYESKYEALTSVGIPVASTPWEVPKLLKDKLQKR